jgi:hypothetical protein
MSSNELEQLIKEEYVPTGIERKKAVLMYFLVWILPVLAGNSLSVYERFHLKQALGWWMIFFLLLIFSVMFFFIPFIRVFPFFLFMILFWIWILFVKQAWEGYYTIDNKKIMLPIFYWLWNWFYEIFEFDNKFDKWDESKDRNSEKSM